MKNYSVDVTEKRHVSVTYHIEAENEKEALAKAMNGEVLYEIENGRQSFEGRLVQEETLICTNLGTYD